MSDYQPTPADRPHPLPSSVDARPDPWVPGEMLVSVHANIPPGTDPRPIVAAVRSGVARALGRIEFEAPSPDNEPPLNIPAGGLEQHLLFVHFRLTSPDVAVMRQAISRINRLKGTSELGDGIELIGATPNWFAPAQQGCDGPSPASQPVPAREYGSRVRYAPQLKRLDLVRKAEEVHEWHQGPVVAVLDTAPTQINVNDYPHNRHLHEVMEKLVPPFGELGPGSALESARATAVQLLQDGGFHPVGPPEPYDVADHGLFIAGVVHATAPWARLRLIRVMNDYGVGSLHTLVIALVSLAQAKEPNDALIVNLSLGMLPPLEQLADFWFGLPITGLTGCPEDPTLQFVDDEPNLTPSEVIELVKRKDRIITNAIGTLDLPVQRLMEVLRSNNCLIAAAAGNDSAFRGVDRKPRWDPRIPALYDTVLGVAAAVRPGVAARYSNRGEEPPAPVRDGVATLGGDLAADGLTPVGGVIGVYTAKHFPPLPPTAPPALNSNGWAEWSGTSFATPIMAGVAANLWMTDIDDRADVVLKRINARARENHRPDVPDLGVPGIPVRLTWLP